MVKINMYNYKRPTFGRLQVKLDYAYISDVNKGIRGHLSYNITGFLLIKDMCAMLEFSPSTESLFKLFSYI